MKRDLNLVREILMRLEPLSATPDQPVPLDVGKEPLDIPGYTGQACCHPRAVALFRSGLRPARCRARRDGPRTIEVARVRITEAGRRALSPSDYPHQLQEQGQ